MAGAVGTLVVFGLSWGMARVLPQRHARGGHARCGLTGWSGIGTARARSTGWTLASS